MTEPTRIQQEPIPAPSTLRLVNSEHSGVSWAAIFAGALAAAALSILLFSLGAGLGLSSTSPWSGQGFEASAAGWTAVAWVLLTQLASAGLGGYMAGRLRVRWQGLQREEVYFRDTAHGFLSWSLATLMMLVVTGTVAGSALLGTAGAADSAVVGMAAAGTGKTASVTGEAQAPGRWADSIGNVGTQRLGYWVDSLFRQDSATGAAAQSSADDATATPQHLHPTSTVSREVSAIYAQALPSGQLSDEDARYVARRISEHTDIPLAQAQARVQKLQQQIEQARKDARQMAETARRTTAYSMLWFFVALLIGAAVASLLATWGGRQRDAH